MRTHNPNSLLPPQMQKCTCDFLYSVFGLGCIEMGTSVRLAAKGDMEILMSWPKVVATVGAVIVVAVIIAPPICKG